MVRENYRRGGEYEREMDEERERGERIRERCGEYEREMDEER